VHCYSDQPKILRISIAQPYAFVQNICLKTHRLSANAVRVYCSVHDYEHDDNFSLAICCHAFIRHATHISKWHRRCDDSACCLNGRNGHFSRVATNSCQVPAVTHCTSIHELSNTSLGRKMIHRRRQTGSSQKEKVQTRKTSAEKKSVLER